MEAAAGAGNAGRGKDIENIIQANEEEMQEGAYDIDEPREDGEEEQGVENEISKNSTAREDEVDGKREREDEDEEGDEDEVAPKRKKAKSAEKGSDEDEYKESEEVSLQYLCFYHRKFSLKYINE